MRLSELLQNLALGELAGSSLVEIGQYQIKQSELPRVITFVNQALEYFYSNFPLKTNDCIIKLQDGITRYYLDSDYAITSIGLNNLPKYLIDSADKPFKDDVLHILDVSSISGISFTINDRYSDINVNTPEYNCVEVLHNLGQEYLKIQYQARHPKISINEHLDSNTKIHIPSSYETVLQTYIAVLVFNAMGGSHLQESNALFAKFKTLTEELKLSGIGILNDSVISIKPQLRGWI